MLWQLRQRGLPLLLGVPGGGQAWEAPTGSHTRVNLHELKGVHEHVVVGLAGMVQEQPATQLVGMDYGSCRYMQKYAYYMQLYVKYMHNL